MKRDRVVAAAAVPFAQWNKLPYELVIQSIIGRDITVFGKLLCVDKQLQKWISLQRQNGIIYANLLKYNFPTAYCLLHELTYADDLETIDKIAQHSEYKHHIAVLFGYTTYNSMLMRNRPLTWTKLDGINHASFDHIVASLSMDTPFVAHSLTPESRHEKNGTEHSYSKSDAKKMARFASVFSPFGYPDGNFYMKSCNKHRPLIVEIFRRSLKYTTVISAHKVIVKGSDGARFRTTPLNAFLIHIVKSVYWGMEAIKKRGTITEGSAATTYEADFICKFDLDNCPGLKELTTEKILKYWEEYLAPYMEGNDKILICYRPEVPDDDEDDFYYESIDQFAFAVRLTEIARHHFNRSSARVETPCTRLYDSLHGLQMAVIQSTYVNTGLEESKSLLPRIDIKPILDLCKSTNSCIQKQQQPRGVAVSGFDDVYCVFRSFLYLSLNK